MRPDGIAPNVGDNDDARVLSFDTAKARDHRPLLGAGASFFGDENLKAAAGSIPACLIWLLGSQGIAAWNSLPTISTSNETKYFKDSGVVIVRNENNFLWVDVGDVGLAGRGGHGHNDILSFELVLQGIAVVVDPGSFVYTADPEARNLFRSTAYHNGLSIDGTEIAPMYGMWTINDCARPLGIQVKTEGTTSTIWASHNGYCRLSDPVMHTRKIKFDVKTGTFLCEDSLGCAGCHRVERYLHLDQSIEVSTKGKHAVLRVGNNAWLLRWGTGTDSHVIDGWVSPTYSVRQASRIIVLTDTVKGSVDLSFIIETAKC